MKTHVSQRFKRVTYRLIKGDVLVLIAAVLLFAVLMAFKALSGMIDWQELDPTSGLVEMVIVAVIGWAVIVLKRILLNRLEDDVKLTSDYAGLVSTYLPTGLDPASASFVTYDNTRASAGNQDALKKACPELEQGGTALGSLEQTVFPVVVDHYVALLPTNQIQVTDSQDVYELPIVIQANYRAIIAAHQGSHLYNQTVIRVRDWSCEGGQLRLFTERSSYCNSMVTNRAMDYDFGEISVRKILEYGPSVNPLSRSRLSNHLGFYAFVVTSDGYVPFVKRSRRLSVGKGTYGDSIGASLKAKYALDPDTGLLTAQGITAAVVREIADELKVREDELPDCPMLIAAYRDLLEGGKPQLLVYTRTSLTRDELSGRFQEQRSQKARRNLPKDVELLEDGKEIAWLSGHDLRHAAIVPSGLHCGERHLPMVPSASASVAMLLVCDAEHGRMLLNA